jgi:hypothetical protein
VRITFQDRSETKSPPHLWHGMIHLLDQYSDTCSKGGPTHFRKVIRCDE